MAAGHQVHGSSVCPPKLFLQLQGNEETVLPPPFLAWFSSSLSSGATTTTRDQNDKPQLFFVHPSCSYNQLQRKRRNDESICGLRSAPIIPYLLVSLVSLDQKVGAGCATKLPFYHGFAGSDQRKLAKKTRWPTRLHLVPEARSSRGACKHGQCWQKY